MTPVDVLLPVRTVAAEFKLVGAGVVEVLPERHRDRRRLRARRRA
jgi:hypothetical protein